MMNPHFLELYQKAHSVRTHAGDPALDGNPSTVYWQGDVSAEKFARLIYKDIITVVAAQAMMGETALDVFINLERIYNDQPKSS
jgi:hypothetical protein